jgi:hypothetical protein
VVAETEGGDGDEDRFRQREGGRRILRKEEGGMRKFDKREAEGFVTHPIPSSSSSSCSSSSSSSSKSAFLPGITRQRVGLPLKIFD